MKNQLVARGAMLPAGPEPEKRRSIFVTAARAGDGVATTASALEAIHARDGRPMRRISCPGVVAQDTASDGQGRGPKLSPRSVAGIDDLPGLVDFIGSLRGGNCLVAFPEPAFSEFLERTKRLKMGALLADAPEILIIVCAGILPGSAERAQGVLDRLEHHKADLGPVRMAVSLSRALDMPHVEEHEKISAESARRSIPSFQIPHCQLDAPEQGFGRYAAEPPTPREGLSDSDFILQFFRWSTFASWVEDIKSGLAQAGIGPDIPGLGRDDVTLSATS